MKNKTPVIAINFFFEACFHPAFSRSPREYVTLNRFFGTLSFLLKFLGFQCCFLMGFCSKREWYILLASFPDISKLYKININFCKYVISFATTFEETSVVIFEDKVCLYSTLLLPWRWWWMDKILILLTLNSLNSTFPSPDWFSRICSTWIYEIFIIVIIYEHKTGVPCAS